MGSKSLALAVAGALLAFPSVALAYCRTTTCDPKDPEQVCLPNALGCVEEGLELFWPERCIHFGTQQDGSPRRNISYDDANAVIQEAFRQWISVSCDGAPPSFSIYDLGEPYGGIECSEPEFNQTAPNANVWMFRDTDWPYTGEASTLALTTITFEVPTGEILDADVEINTFRISISIGDAAVENDFLSIATHEAGHFLGLSHSHIGEATMNANYSPGDIEFRTLHADDIEGICAIYPPDRDSPNCEDSGPTPRHGFSRFCSSDLEPTESSCSVAPVGNAPDPRGTSGAAWLAAAGLASVMVRRRRRR